MSSFIKSDIILSNKHTAFSLYMSVGGHLYSLTIIKDTAENMGVEASLQGGGFCLL